MRLGRKWAFFFGSVLAFGLLSFYLPEFPVEQETAKLIVSVTGILFGLLSSFFISEMWSKYTTIRKLSGEFKGQLLMLIDNVKFVSGSEKFKDSFREEMEKYLIAYHMVPWHRVEMEQDYFQGVIDTIDELDESEADGGSYAEVLDCALELRKTRNKMINIGKAKLLLMEWVVILSLTAMFIVALFALRDGSLALNIVSTVLPSVAVLILLFLDDLNKIKWNETHISFEPGEAALDSLDVPRFYESEVLEKNSIDIPGDKDYRTEEDLEGELREVYEEMKELR